MADPEFFINSGLELAILERGQNRFLCSKICFFSFFLMKYFQNYQFKARAMAKRCQAGRAMHSLNFESSYGPEDCLHHANLPPKIAVGILDSLYKKTHSHLSA